MGHVSGEMETLRKNQKEMLEINNTVKERKNAFDGLLSRLDTAKERISDLEYIPPDTSQMERQSIKKEKKKKKKQNKPRTMGRQLLKYNICMMRMPGEETEKGTEDIHLHKYKTTYEHSHSLKHYM